MKREDYRRVKQMDKLQMEQYLSTIYQRGYEAGMKAAGTHMETPKPAAAPKPRKPREEKLPLTAAEEAAEQGASSEG